LQWKANKPYVQAFSSAESGGGRRVVYEGWAYFSRLRPSQFFAHGRRREIMLMSL
jgi:hypothetical protein